MDSLDPVLCCIGWFIMIYPFLPIVSREAGNHKPNGLLAMPESMRKDGCRLGETCHLPQKSEAWCWAG